MSCSRIQASCCSLSWTGIGLFGAFVKTEHSGVSIDATSCRQASSSTVLEVDCIPVQLDLLSCVVGLLHTFLEIKVFTPQLLNKVTCFTFNIFTDFLIMMTSSYACKKLTNEQKLQPQQQAWTSDRLQRHLLHH